MPQPVRPADAMRPVPARPYFVGRERELAELSAMLASARSGQGQTALLAGEAGIGKTRLVEELGASAPALGFDVFWGQCEEWAGLPAYWPWTQILGPLVSGIDDETLLDWLGPDARRLVQIEPDIARRRIPWSELPRLSPDQERFELFRAVSGVLRNVSAARPLMLVIEDLHWADAASLALVRFVARSLRAAPILLVATYRHSEVRRSSPLSDTLASVAREPGHMRLTLRGLSRGNVADFVSHALQRAPDEKLADAVFNAVEGNPFFMVEMVRLLRSDDRLDLGDDIIRVPETVRDVIRQRLDRLPTVCAERLGVASVIGREFGLGLLSDATGRTPGEVVAELEPALEAGLIEAPAPDRNRFVHALVQETLYDDMPLSQRLVAHQSVGLAMEIRIGETGAHDAELAHHFGQAAAIGNADKAATFALNAARTALAQHAWETAIEQCSAALRAVELDPSCDPELRCELLLLLGEAQTQAGAGRERAILMGTSPEAFATYWHAAKLAQTEGLAELLARAALGLAGPSLGAPQAGPDGIVLMEQALAALPAHDSPLRAQLMARVAVDTARLWSIGAYPLTDQDIHRFIQRSDEAVAVARRTGDHRTLAFALATRREGREGSGRLADWLADAEEIVRLARTSNDPMVAMWGLDQQYDVLTEMGETAAARQVADEIERLGRRMQTPLSEGKLANIRAGQALREGRLDVAEAFIDRAKSIWPDTAITAFQTVTLRREQLRMQEVSELMRSRFENYPNSPLWRSLWILLHHEAGDMRTAIAHFEELAARDFLDIPRGVFWLRSMAWLAEAAAQLSDAARASQIFEMLLPCSRRNIYLRNSDHTGGAVDYYLGLLATTMERWQDADHHLKIALEMNERTENWPYAAYTRHAWAAMLARRGDASDRQQAADLNQQALRSAIDMGMDRLVFHARELQERLDTAPESEEGAGDTYGLSAREFDVLRLVAAGRTNREIGEALFISPRTVGSHVSNILGKLGVTTRTEAAACAIHERIVTPPGEES